MLVVDADGKEGVVQDAMVVTPRDAFAADP
jgi:hypothetical protein